MDFSIALEDDRRTACQLLLFTEVENCVEVRKQILGGKVEASLLKPNLVVSPFQVAVAANRAVRVQALNKMATRSLYTEVIFNLSTKKNIGNALKTFGMGDEDKEVLAVVLGTEEEVEARAKKIKEQIKGKVTAISELATLTQESQVKELYKVTKEDLSVGSLLEAVVARMACRDFLTL
ncbi:EKC/KEOPS complex subunit Tprkb [Chionoecetes opilio]|uniref:EKC/KEOPS complex subunit Tprkb n=1 Tax=Chionoecetes opilio TaxID=41210 RepID=A0A8J4XQB6_CHIOP|nr:EKC/KEOPS complex subunit Tprkb [Chionoecetes opilio]